MVMNTTLLSWYFLIFAAAYNVFFVVNNLFQRFYINTSKRPDGGNQATSIPDPVKYLSIIIPARDEDLVIEHTIDTIMKAFDEGLHGSH